MGCDWNCSPLQNVVVSEHVKKLDKKLPTSDQEEEVVYQGVDGENVTFRKKYYYKLVQ